MPAISHAGFFVLYFLYIQLMEKMMFNMKSRKKSRTALKQWRQWRAVSPTKSTLVDMQLGTLKKGEYTLVVAMDNDPTLFQLSMRSTNGVAKLAPVSINQLFHRYPETLPPVVLERYFEGNFYNFAQVDFKVTKAGRFVSMIGFDRIQDFDKEVNYFIIYKG